MKVLHINEHLALSGGVETYLFSLIPRLRDRNIESVMAYGAGDPSLYDACHHVPEIKESGFTSHPSARRRMREVLRSERPGLIHVHNIQNVGILQACLEYGPTVLTTHDHRWVCPANTFYYKRTREICDRTCGVGCFTTTLTKHCLTPRPQYAAYFYYRVKWGVRHSDEIAHFFAPSTATKERHVKGGINSRKITALPYFCSFVPADRPRTLPDPPTITYMGRIASNKGHEFFIEALGQLPDAVQGILVGNMDGDTESEIRKLARRHGCQDRLTTRGWASREEIPDILDRTSVFVFPSLCVETLGIVGLEALSRGVPVVASDVGGVREWCRGGETGYVVPTKDASAIAGRVRHLLADADRLRAFGERGIALIRDKFLPDRHIDRLLEVYDRVSIPDSTRTGMYV